MSDIFPAATVVLIRDKGGNLEVLLLRRANTLAFGAGNWVFPGGKIDQADYHNDPDNTLEAAQRAAVRETWEEAQIAINTDFLVFFAHWTTPEHLSKRFATWFFVTEVANGINVQIDDEEIVESRWYKPLDALKAQHNGLLEMMPPTFVTLTELSKCSNSAAAIAIFKRSDVSIFEPVYLKGKQQTSMLYHGDSGYSKADANTPEPHHRVIISDSGWRYIKDI